MGFFSISSKIETAFFSKSSKCLCQAPALCHSLPQVAALALLGSRLDRGSFAVSYLLVLKKTIPLQWNRHGEFAEGMTTLQGNLIRASFKSRCLAAFLCFCLQCSQISVKNLPLRFIPPKAMALGPSRSQRHGRLWVFDSISDSHLRQKLRLSSCPFGGLALEDSFGCGLDAFGKMDKALGQLFPLFIGEGSYAAVASARRGR